MYSTLVVSVLAKSGWILYIGLSHIDVISLKISLSLSIFSDALWFFNLPQTHTYTNTNKHTLMYYNDFSMMTDETTIWARQWRSWLYFFFVVVVLYFIYLKKHALHGRDCLFKMLSNHIPHTTCRHIWNIIVCILNYLSNLQNFRFGESVETNNIWQASFI